jgi:hypothetical protein
VDPEAVNRDVDAGTRNDHTVRAKQTASVYADGGESPDDTERRIDRVEIQVGDLERILGPLQANIKIFFVFWSLIVSSIGILTGLGAKVGFVWFRTKFREESQHLSTTANSHMDRLRSRIEDESKSYVGQANKVMADIGKAADDAIAKMNKRVESCGREAEIQGRETIGYRLEYLSAQMRDLIAWTLEWLAKGDPEILRARDTFKAMMLTESAVARNVRNGCLNLQAFHTRGHPGAELVLPRLYETLRKWVEKVEQAKTNEAKQEAQQVIKMVNETIKILQGKPQIDVAGGN